MGNEHERRPLVTVEFVAGDDGTTVHLHHTGFASAESCANHRAGWQLMVSVETQIAIARPRADVADYACDPDNATAWYRNIKEVTWESPRPLAVGSRIAFVAQFLGRRLAYTYEVIEIVPGERFVMRTAQGPFPMQTSYAWRDLPDGATQMTLRNHGDPAGFARVAAPVMARAIRRANQNDLRLLKHILESRPS